MKKKDVIDSLFDGLDRIVDGAATVLKDVPESDSDDEEDDEPSPVVDKRIIDIPVEKSKPLLKSDSQQESPMAGKKQPREVTLSIKNVSRRRGGGVTLIAETPTHELVAVQLSQDDWKKVYDAADWFRMVQD